MISVFVETGIQYMDLEGTMDFQDAEASLSHGFHIAAGGRITPRPAPRPDEGLGGDIGLEGNQEEGDFYCSPLDALELFARQWIPVPYHTTNPFWVRAFLERTIESTGQAYRIVLACDTHSRWQKDDDGLGLLRETEIGYAFSINAELPAFWDHHEVREIAYAAWDAWVRRTHPDVDPADLQLLPLAERPPAALAKLWALVRYLSRKLPEIQILKGTENQPVDAHLVLDLGNCRTCGILMEVPANQDPLFASLEMRSHELPCRKSEGPFESHMQFVRPGFGSSKGPSGNGRFHGISLIRLGDEALEASAHAWCGMTSALTGMSSPKRYLWDNNLRPSDWCFVPEHSDGDYLPIEGDVLRYVEQERPFRQPQVMLLPNPVSPRYSRKTGLIFFLVEILEQAFAQMNSVAHRRQMPVEGGEQRRRVLKTLVLIHPSGMTPLERQELEEGVRRAVDIWYDAYRDPAAFRTGQTQALPPPPIQPKPVVRVDCDEATAVQLCYLYGEIQARFKGNAERFLETTGSDRGGRKVLRLASLDVGGGTTDLVIADYETVPGAIGFTCLKHRPKFRDGINLGGDDVAKVVLTDIVFRDIFEQWGINRKEWERAFSQTPGAMDPQWERVRRQLVSQVWNPVIRYFWGRTERNLPDETVTLGQILRQTRYPEELLKRFNEYLGKLAGGRSIDVSATELHLNAKDFNLVTRKVLSRPLYNFCDIIAQFDCDILIVAGRPAGLPELMKMLVEYCPLPPARIASLQGHPVEGNWFPFARDGVIADAKSCVVVGAAIYYLAVQIKGSFDVESEGQWPNLVIIGIAERHLRLVPEKNVLFRPGDSTQVSGQFMFAGNLWLGCRNIDDERAYANALYEVTWQPSVQQLIRDVKMPTPRVSLCFARRPNDPFALSIHSVQGRTETGRPITREHISLKLHTIYTDDYWLDTGCFYDKA